VASAKTSTQISQVTVKHIKTLQQESAQCQQLQFISS